MRIYISVDIEGVAGVVHVQQGSPGNADYEAARRLMLAEANAAIAGAFAGGATAVVVSDSHGPMINLLPDELDPRAELILGRPRPVTMVAGIEAGFAGLMMVGYHAGACRPGILAHTFSGAPVFRRVSVNGIELNEAALYGAHAGALGVPVILLSGDDRLAADARGYFPDAEIVTVKRALSNRSARSLSPAEARRRIAAAAETAVRRAGSIRPFVIPPPLRLEVVLGQPIVGDAIGAVPGVTRLDATTVTMAIADMAEATAWIATIADLAKANL